MFKVVCLSFSTFLVSSEKDNHIGFIVGGVLVFAALVCIVIFSVILLCWRRKRKARGLSTSRVG